MDDFYETVQQSLRMGFTPEMIRKVCLATVEDEMKEEVGAALDVVLADIIRSTNAP